LPEDEPGEVVGGVLVEEEVPDIVHETVIMELGGELRAWVRPRGGIVAGSGTKLGVAPDGGRMPDVAVFFADNLPARGALTRRAPDIAVEVLSQTPRDQRRDRIEKRREYAAFGVRYDWILDPWARTLEILELGDDRRYKIVFDAAEGKHDQIPGCDGLALDLDMVWAAVDRIGDAGDPVR